MDVLFDHWRLLAVVAVIAVLLVCYRFVLWLFGVIIVPDDSVGMVTKKFVLFGGNRSLPDGRIVALHGEAGFQANTLSPGLHIGLWPWQYAVDLAPFLTVPQGKVGTVEACDGRPLGSGRMVAREVACDSFQDARTFLTSGGERGPQMTLIPPGHLSNQHAVLQGQCRRCGDGAARQNRRRGSARRQAAVQWSHHRAPGRL